MSEQPKFELDVVNSFEPIMRDFGYNVVQSSDSYVRLDSQNASIQIRYDRQRSFEVDVSFSLQRGGELLNRIPFNLGEVYRECGVPDASECWFLQTSDYSKVTSFLNSTCDLLRTHCGPILAGDEDAFTAVGERRTREAAAYTQQVQLRAVHEKANQAWKDRRFQEYLDLLERFEDVLSESDRKKLEYASEKVQGV